MEDECFFHQNYILIQAHWIKNNNNKDNICKKNIMIWYLQKKKKMIWTTKAKILLNK